MENLALKMKLAVLWLYSAVSLSAFTVLDFIRPGVIEEVVAGETRGVPISEGYLLSAAIFWLIPLTMAFPSLTLKDSTNRRANVIVGILFAVFSISGLGESLILGALAHSLIAVSMIVAVALIVWYAWKWPKQELVTKPKE